MKTSILDGISGEDALRVLRNLCAADAEMRERILSEVEKLLSEVDRDSVADEVFFDLDGLSVDELWDRSGPKRHGYSSPDETAVEMIGETLKPYEDKVNQYQEMGMPDQSKQYCMGVLKGIHQFDQESQSEFKEQAPDVPGDCFGGILDEWRRRCTRKHDIQDMNEFISRECPKWAKWATKNETS
jgi:hypothetical protein